MSCDKNGNAKIVMHNHLARNIIVKQIYSLTVEDQRVINYLVATGIDHTTKTLPPVVRGEVAEIAKLCGITTGGEMYKAVKKAIINLMGNIIQFIDPTDGRPVISTWLSQAKYFEGEGYFEVSFPPILRSVLTDLSKNRTEFDLQILLGLGGGAYALRLYQIAKSWQSVGGWTTSIDELRSQLGIKTGTFAAVGSLKQKVIDYSLKSINKKSDIRVSYIQGNKGKKWTHIKFVISEAKSFRVIDPSKPKRFTDLSKNDQERAWDWLRASDWLDAHLMPQSIDWDAIPEAAQSHAFTDWLLAEKKRQYLMQSILEEARNPAPKHSAR